MNKPDNNYLKLKVILLITMYFPPEIGGGSTGAWNRALLFKEMGFKVFVLTGFPTYPSGRLDNPKYEKKRLFMTEYVGSFKVLRIRLIPLSHNGIIRPMIIFMSFLFLCIVYLPIIYKSIQAPYIVYARSPIIFSSFIGLVYSKVFQSRFFYEVPDLWPEELFFRKNLFSSALYFAGRILAKLSYYFPEKIITTTKYSERFLRDKYDPKNEVIGIPAGVNIQEFKGSAKKEARVKLIDMGIFDGQLSDKFIVLYTGRISAAQGIDRITNAAEKLKHNRKIVLLVVGEGPDKKYLQKTKSQKNLDNLILLPPQRRELIPTIVSACDACTIFLSSEPIFQVVFPTKFYEYLACSKPIIGVCQGEIAELIRTRKIGQVCDFEKNADSLASIILQMSESPEELSKYEENSVKTLDMYSIQELSRKYTRVFLDKKDSL